MRMVPAELLVVQSDVGWECSLKDWRLTTPGDSEPAPWQRGYWKVEMIDDSWRIFKQRCKIIDLKLEARLQTNPCPGFKQRKASYWLGNLRLLPRPKRHHLSNKQSCLLVCASTSQWLRSIKRLLYDWLEVNGCVRSQLRRQQDGAPYRLHNHHRKAYHEINLRQEHHSIFQRGGTSYLPCQVSIRRELHFDETMADEMK